MTIRELKSNLREIVKRYFRNASVLWAGENEVKATGTLVTLRLGDIQRSRFPIITALDGAPVRLYEAHTMLEVNLYTKGAVTPPKPGIRPRATNSAVSDLQEFVDYMDSFLVEEISDRLNIALMPEGPTRDISELVDDTQFEYRAMQEFTLDFLQGSAGFAGVIHVTTPGTKPPDGTVPPDGQMDCPMELLPWEETSSGGGSKDLADIPTGWFEAVETSEMKEESQDDK